MLRNRMKALFAVAVLSLAHVAHAGVVLVNGNSMDSSNPIFTTNLAKLSGSTFQFDSPANFASLNLSGFSAVWLDGFSQYISLASLTPYLNAGGTVLVQNPGFGSEPLSAYPMTTGLSATFVSGDAIRVVNPGHPLNAGLTNANLSGWGQSAFGILGGIPPEWTVLSDTGNPSESITIVRSVGAGTLVYTEQGISQSLSASDLAVTSGQLTLLNNIISSNISSSAPESSSVALFALGLGLAGILRRRG